MSHTPGPWTIQERSDDYSDGYFIEADSLGLDICTVATAGHKDKTQCANARLIAAAPELLAALKATIGIMESNTHLDLHRVLRTAEIKDARAAIAKAEGRS